MNDVLYVNIWLLLILRSIRGVFPPGAGGGGCLSNLGA